MSQDRAVIGVALCCVLCGCEQIAKPGQAQTPPEHPADSAPSSNHAPPAPDQAADQPARAEVAPPTRLVDEDKGIFADLDEQVTLEFPSWVSEQPFVVMDLPGDAGRYAYLDGAFIGLAGDGMGPVLSVEELGRHDADADGIPDSFDIMVGARKAELNEAKYLGGYEQLEYPSGDVSRDKGVCTDVVIRAVRNAGIDLQVELHQDIKRSPKSFPMVKKANPHIDQRRVKTLLPYFKRHWRSLSTEPDDKSSPWLPGDILFMQTMGDKRPDHLAIVSDELGSSGYPLTINNFTDGYSTAAMDLLTFVPVTHRFRRVAPKVVVASEHRGLEGVLARQGLELAPEHEQVVLVTAPYYSANEARLRRYEKTAEGEWEQLGRAVEVRLGEAGLGLGRGEHGAASARLAGTHTKQEGDLRSPAGVFRIGYAFGPGEKPYKGSWSWERVGEADRWVDDPRSASYNTRVSSNSVEKDWVSAEAMSSYRLGVVIEHNTREIEASAGSAIFMHIWDKKKSPTLGCTSMAKKELVRVLEWLNEDKSPVLIQVAEDVF